MDKVWTALMILGLGLLCVYSPQSVLSTMLEASKQALTFCFGMCGIYAVWLGIFEILRASGLSEKLAKLFRPLIKKIFRTENPYAQEQISLNLAANLLGLGSAATPAGIEAMRAMDNKSGKPTFGMIMLFMINATSIQLIPTTAISLRLTQNCATASDIILPTLISTFVTTALGVLCVILIENLKRKKQK